MCFFFGGRGGELLYWDLAGPVESLTHYIKNSVYIFSLLIPPPPPPLFALTIMYAYTLNDTDDDLASLVRIHRISTCSFFKVLFLSVWCVLYNFHHTPTNSHSNQSDYARVCTHIGIENMLSCCPCCTVDKLDSVRCYPGTSR